MTTLLAAQKRFLAEAEPATFVDLGDGRRLTSSLRTPDGILAPMTYETTRTWAYQHACRLPRRAEALAMSGLPHIPVQSILWNDPDFGTVEGARRYTERVDYQVGARHLGFAGSPVVDNESKVWVRDPGVPGGPGGAVGMPHPGWALLVGFFDAAGKPANTGQGSPGKKGYGPRGEPHDSSHVDYSMAPRFVFCDHETKRGELLALASALAGPSGARSPTLREVADYFRLGVRDDASGRPQRTGYTQGWDWCAAGACWLGAEAGLGLGVHEWRITVWELIADARASGRWREPGDGEPQVGDLVCFKRKGDPRNPGETGHVETYIGRDRTLSGNSPGWLIKLGRMASPDYIGRIAR